MSAHNAATLRAAQADLLADVAMALQTASDTPTHDQVTFRTASGTARVTDSRERLERFAAAVRTCAGYRAASATPRIRRDREEGRAMRATAPDGQAKALEDAALQSAVRQAKAQVMDRMRGALAGSFCYPPAMRVRDAESIDAMQRELVARGLLDATDHDKVNAAPVCGNVETPPAPVAVSTEVAPERAIMAAVNACLDDAAARYPTVGRLSPVVRFDVRSKRCLAEAVRKGAAYTLRFNMALFAAYPEHMLRHTIPHEIAHLVADALGYGLRHCRHWRAICLALGGNGQRLMTRPAAQALPLVAPPPARRLRAVPVPARAPAPIPSRPAAVEYVEAIESADGRLVLVAFDDDAELLGLHEGFEHRIRKPQDLRAALQALSAGDTLGWPPASATAQATYDRLTARQRDYSVIGRWSRDDGLDLRELRLSRLLGRGPRCILVSPLAA